MDKPNTVSIYYRRIYLSTSVSVMCAVTALFSVAKVLGGTIVFYTNPVIPSTASISARFTYFLLQVTVIINSVTTVSFAMLLIQGLMERNIVHLYLASFFNGAIYALLCWSYLKLAINFREFIFLGLNIAAFLFICFILGYTYYMRKEIGWFYYKSYGADPKQNLRCNIRKILEVSHKIMGQNFVSFWMGDFFLEGLRHFFIAEICIYYVLFVLGSESTILENYPIRITCICLSMLIDAYLICQLCTPRSFLNPVIDMPSSSIPNSTISIWMLGKAIRLVVQLLYTLFLLLDTFSFGKKVGIAYFGKQKRRMVLEGA